MLLSQKDIERLVCVGYNRDQFVRLDKAGYSMLRNKRRRCVFYDVEKQRCKEYSSRPEGCRVYPIILDETKGIVIDDICTAIVTVTSLEKAQKGLRVLKLLKKIDSEATKNAQPPNSNSEI